jgi:hypothetical protein
MNFNKLLLSLLIFGMCSCDDEIQTTQTPDMNVAQEEDPDQDMAGIPVQYMDFDIIEIDAEIPTLDPDMD